MISLNYVMGIVWRWKKSIICLRLTFYEILHEIFWVSWGVLFKGLGVQKDTQTPCWLRLWWRTSGHIWILQHSTITRFNIREIMSNTDDHSGTINCWKCWKFYHRQCGINSFDFVFSQSCIYLTIWPVRCIYWLKALPVEFLTMWG